MEIRATVTAYIKFAILIVISVVSLHAGAVSPPTVSGNQSSGNYTVTYNYTPSYPALYVWLEEKIDGGPWTTVTDSTPFGTIDFTGKTNGTYQYRVGQLEDSYYYPIPFQVFWSSAVTVMVTGGGPSAMSYSTQSTYTYQAKKGDINADGLQDLYIKRTSGGASNNGVLYETILTQMADKSFSVLSATASQKTTAASWPVINVNIKSADFNIDGFVDVVVKGINTHIPNVDNQVVFSSGSASNGQADIATSLGSLMTKTMTNISGSLSTPNYFTQFMTQVPVQVEYPDCGYYYDYYSDSWRFGCWIVSYTVWLTGYDSNFVSQDGLDFGLAWGALDQAATDADFREISEYLYDVVGNILGIEFGKDRPDFNDQGAVEEVLAKIWVILSDLCGEAGVLECVSQGSQTVGEEVSHGLTGLQNCTDQLLSGQASLPFIGNPFRSPKVAHSSTQNFAITSSQLSYSTGTNNTARRNFWLSRFNDSKDPLGPLGVNVVDNAYLLGCLANERTLLFAYDYGKTVSLTSIGVDMMEAHSDAVQNDVVGILGKLRASDIAAYHFQVFAISGLPPRTFGGAPFTGIASEAEKTKFIWCPSCEE